jgi:hypothetical protein
VPRYVGRAAERDRLSSVLGQLRVGLSAVLVLSGEAGIGMTHLLRWPAENAAGIQTVLVSGYEAEVGLGFAALHRLLLPLLSDPAELPDPQRDALGAAFGLVSGPAPSRFLVGLATVTLLQQAARKQPLPCVVDDVRWTDQETLHTLGFAGRRLDAEGVGLVLGRRGGARAPAGLRGIPEYRLVPMPEPNKTAYRYGARARSARARRTYDRVMEGSP